MKAQTPINVGLSLLCFSVVLAIYQESLSLLSISGQPGTTRLIKFAIAAGLFAFMLQLGLLILNAASRRWFSDDAKLVGRWYQVLHIHNYAKSDWPTDTIRHGQVTIAHSAGLLEITAENRRLSSVNTSSTWYSDKVSIQGSQVWLLYSSNGAGRGSTHGFMLFQYQPGRRFTGRPDRLTGQFCDSSPAIHYGSIELFRDLEAYKTRLQEMTGGSEALSS